MKIYIDPQGKKHGISPSQSDLVQGDWVECQKKQDGTYAQNYNLDGTPAPDDEPTVSQVVAEGNRRQDLVIPANKVNGLQAKYNSLVKRSGSLTPAQDAEKDALDDKWDAIDSLVDKTETISEMTPIPQDFTDDSYWS